MLVEFKEDYKGVPKGAKGFLRWFDGCIAIVITTEWGIVPVDLSTGVLKSQ